METISPSRTTASLWNSIGSGSVSWNCTMRRSKPLLALAQDRVAADEIGFLRADGKAEAGLQHVILVGDVMAEMAEGLFDAAAVERVQPAELEAVIAVPPPVSVSNTCAAWSVET
jgi:hypothetical protein